MVDLLFRLIKVEELRWKIQELFYVELGLQRLFYRGKQMEDGYIFFDYEVCLNDIIQFLVCQSFVFFYSIKEWDFEFFDIDFGCCLGQSELDKFFIYGEVVVEIDSRLVDEDMWDEMELGLYKVNEYVDVWDMNMGVWFEVQVVRVMWKVFFWDEFCSFIFRLVLEEDVIYYVKYDDYLENGVVQMNFRDV